ncbi:hypothetical protein GCM10025873_16470 [Demequina sediminis]|nr:hypothetical protein GCM10025873_16470 [Demequina sediminis]
MHVLAVEQDHALARGQEARERAQQGRLAAAVGADDRGDAAVGNRDADVVHHDVVAVAERDVLGLKPGHAGPPRDARHTSHSR